MHMCHYMLMLCLNVYEFIILAFAALGDAVTAKLHRFRHHLSCSCVAPLQVVLMAVLVAAGLATSIHRKQRK